MDTGATAPSPDEGWHFEWRWGAAHPWLRSNVASSSSAVSAVSFMATSSPRFPSPALPSVSPCCSSYSSLHGSTGITSKLSPSPVSPTSRACPSSFVETQKPEPLDTSKKEEGCQKEAAFSSLNRPSASSWSLSPSFLSFFCRTQLHGIPTASQHESTACTSSQATAGDTATPAAVAGAATRPPPAIFVAKSLPEGGVKETEPALENGAETTTAQSLISAVSPGAKELARVEGRHQGATAPMIPSRSETLFWNPTPEIEKESASLPETIAATQYGANEKHGLETTVEAAREGGVTGAMIAAAASAASSSAAPTASAATSARSAASALAPATSTAAKVHKEKVEQQKLADTTLKQKQVQQLLLQFGDQTLSFLQKQQMTLWSVFAFRDWRVKTLIHALSAMGEPVNLVVVNCTPPPPSRPSSPSLSSFSPGTSGSSLVSGGFSLSYPRCSFASSLLNPDISSLTNSQVEKRGFFPAAGSGEQQSYFAASVAGIPTTQPVATNMPEVPYVMPPAASECMVSPSTDARRTTAGETTEAGRASQAPCLASASPTIGDDIVRAGYSPLYHTIWLCGNRLWSPFELRRVLLHELVHAFDFARANISPDDCRHVACTEIRAYNLSGQCGWWRTRAYDIEQFNTVEPLPLRKESEAAVLQHKQEGDHVYDSAQWQQTKRNRCLMHGALNSLGQHRRCQAPNVAEEAVREVFTRCVRDTWPFFAPPERDSKWRPSRMWRPEAAEFFKK